MTSGNLQCSVKGKKSVFFLITRFCLMLHSLVALNCCCKAVNLLQKGWYICTVVECSLKVVNTTTFPWHTFPWPHFHGHISISNINGIPDVLNVIDLRRTVALLLLDLSAAFDTVDHELLLHRLCVHFGIRGKALAWFTSYLTGHCQYVTIRGADSSSCSIMHGVLQGSVLGPLLYLLYTIPLGSIVRKHGMMFHFYADDSQIYFSFDSSTPELVNASG